MSKNEPQVKTIKLLSIKGLICETIFVSLAILLPSVMHFYFGREVLIAFSPMHWTIILAGLVLGWEAGLIAGLIVPIMSFIITGMPMQQMILAMTIELTLYGFTAGLLTKKLGVNPFIAIILALLIGRVGNVSVDVIRTLLANGQVTINSITAMFVTKFKPQLLSIAGQIVILPILAILIKNILCSKDKSI